MPPSNAVKAELFAGGTQATEGPAFDAAGNLFVVNLRGMGNIGRILPDGSASVYCNLRQIAPVAGRSPYANGQKFDRQGRLIVADMGGARVLRLTPSSDPAQPPAVEVLADKYNGEPLLAPNDIAFDLAGNVYFTDSGTYDHKAAIGAVYRCDPETRELVRLDANLAFANGIAVSPDQKQLCVAESFRNRVWIYDLTPEGLVANRRVLAEFAKETEAARIAGDTFDPDGIIFDAVGRLYVAICANTRGVIKVLELPTGAEIRQYDSGGPNTTNCHFHDGWLYTTVASQGALYRLKLGVEGFDYWKPRP